jgi:hypothetical protein
VTWCIRGAYSETNPNFGLTWDRWADRIDERHIRMHVADALYLGVVEARGITWTRHSESAGGSDPEGAAAALLKGPDACNASPERSAEGTDVSTDPSFRWERFHIAPHQFAIIRRPAPFFMSSLMFRLLYYLMTSAKAFFVAVFEFLRSCASCSLDLDAAPGQGGDADEHKER